MALLDGLNDEQRIAAATTQGPLIIVAGAGSGKTRTLTYRIAHILEQGENPFRILALTFTNKAAKDMKVRIESLIGPTARSLWMGTFHSVFAKILRVEAERLGYISSFNIYDTDDSKALIRQIVREMNLDPKEYTPNFILSRISAAKNNLLSAQDYVANPSLIKQDIEAKRPKVGEIYLTYSQRLRQSSAMDFDDLLFNMNILLRDFPDALAKYQNKFKYIMVDEYQDTNYAQYLIVKKLSAQHRNICVVGDDSQSIYAFRGANIQNILNFEKDYKDHKKVKLEQNYRSTKNIVNASNAVIDKNTKRIPKVLWTSNEEGEKINILRAFDENEEGILIADKIFEIKNNQRVFNKNFAILYRTNNQSKAVEDALRKRNIAYRIYGGQSFYRRKEIKDVLAYFKWVVNPRDEDAFMRCINNPTRGIGDTTLDRLRILAAAFSCSMWEAIMLIRTNPDGFNIENIQQQVLDNINAVAKGINQGVRLRLWQVCDRIESLHTRVGTTNAYDLAMDIWRASEIGKMLENDSTIESTNKIRNVEELLNSIKNYVESNPQVVDVETGELSDVEGVVSLDLFLQEVVLLTDQDKDTEEDNDKVTLMTIHAAKGLEFPYVFVAGCEENLFPSQMSMFSEKELEEERRLFYVAATRAEKELYLSFALERMRWGQRTGGSPSRFLLEIDSEYLANPEVLKNGIFNSGFSNRQSISSFGNKRFASKASSPKTPLVNVSTSSSSIDTSKLTKISSTQRFSGEHELENSQAINSVKNDGFLAVGDNVIHERFGKGEVLEIIGFEADTKYKIRFIAGVGEKILLKRFAKLQKY